jgi:hypothetical protein
MQWLTTVLGNGLFKDDVASSKNPDQAVHALLEGVESQFKVSQCDG